MDPLITFLNGLNDDFLWGVLQHFDVPDLITLRRNGNRFNTLLTEESFASTYNRDRRGSLWTFTHFYSPHPPHRHRIIGHRVEDNRTVTYLLSDFGVDWDDRVDYIQLVGGFRSVLVFWYGRVGFLICNIWNMTSRVVNFEYWPFMHLQDVLRGTQIVVDEEDPMHYILMYVYEMENQFQLGTRVNVFSSYSSNRYLFPFDRLSMETNPLNDQEMGSLIYVGRSLDENRVLLVSNWERRIVHMFEEVGIAYDRVNLHQLLPIPHNPNIILNHVSHESVDGHLLTVESWMVDLNGQQGHRFGRVMLFHMAQGSTGYQFVSSMPFEEMPQEALTFVGHGLLRSFDEYVELSTQVAPPEDVPNLWRCLIVRYHRGTNVWSTWREEMIPAFESVGGVSITVRLGPTT